MSIQSQLNDDSINCLPRIAAIIAASQPFEANQIYCYMLQSMLNLSVCVDDKSTEELEEYQNNLIATFKEKGWLAREIILSKTHGIKTEAMCGQGLIVEGGEFPCSVGCQHQVDGTKKYSQVFGVINHPLQGKIAVTVEEFAQLGLPEIEGF